MPDFSIERFWRARLSVVPISRDLSVRGWFLPRDRLTTFKEAPLTESSELDARVSPQQSSIILVSAPGAVGKSTLARQIACETGSVYVDLARTDPVGGNAVSGGLVKAGIYSEWQSQSTALLIDGLDEARLRVTQEAFEAFINDIAHIANGRSVPTVLFGRTGSVQDAWLMLSNANTGFSVLEIGYYDLEASVDFADARVREKCTNDQHASVRRRAVRSLLERLRAETSNDGDRFGGYAPVLQAVADRVAKETNPAALISQVESGAQPVTLQTVVSAILERERGKLDGMPFEEPTLSDSLYRPQEQLDRLSARVYGMPVPPLPAMKPNDAQSYSNALESWVAEHPFLDGGRGASSAVFAAVIAAHALRNPKSAEVACQKELARGAAANPFLSEFYLPQQADTASFHLPPEHIGIVYSSLRARLSLGDSASLVVEAPEGATEEEALRAEVEISLARREPGRQRVLRFDTEQTGTLKIGAYVEDVELIVPHSRVEVGPGAEAALIAPVNIQCGELAITASKVIAECPPSYTDAAVYLEAGKFEGTKIESIPILRGNVALTVIWPQSQAHPWTSFSITPPKVPDARLDEALRRFRRFVTAFRSHSKGSLARYQHKIEHERMTKGMGTAVLKLMIESKVLSLSGSMYFLDPKRLGAEAGVSYADCMARRFGDKAIKFVERAL